MRSRTHALGLKCAILTVVVVALILHGSLYPYDFRIPQGDSGAWRTLLASRAKPPASFGDLVANILLYIPFGLFATLTIRLKPLPRCILITAAGFVLCTAIELAQFYDRGRVTNLSDVYLNTFGTILGAAAACLLNSRRRISPLSPISISPVPTLLIAAMLAYHLFPYVPTIDLHKYWQSLKPVLPPPGIAPYAIFHYFALWMTASYLVAAVVPDYPRVASGLFCTFVLLGKIVIVNLVLTVPELLGAGLAVLGAILLPQQRRGTAVFVAMILGTLIVLQRLEPFAFHMTAAKFGWVPFRSFMQGSLAIDIQAFAEKLFLYGGCIWILCKAGLHLRYAAVAVALLLLITSYAEIYLPGRSAEITDAVMSLLAAAIIGILEAWGSGPRLTEPATDPDAVESGVG